MSVFPAGLAADLKHLQTAIDIKFQEDMAACMRAQGWPTDMYDSYRRDIRKRAESGELPPEQDVFQNFIDKVNAAESGSPPPDELPEELQFMDSDAYLEANSACMNESKFNVAHPFADENSLISTWFDAAYERTQSDPRMIAAIDAREQCRRESGIDTQSVYNAANDTLSLTEEEWIAGSISGKEALARAEEAKAKYQTAVDVEERCEAVFLGATNGSIYDEHFQEVAMESPNYAAVVQEITAFTDGYRDILDELNPPD